MIAAATAAACGVSTMLWISERSILTLSNGRLLR
jgi:hypothetical protein